MTLVADELELISAMYGSEDDPYSQRQKMELGDYFENIKYVDCSKEHGLGEFDKEYCKKLTWKILKHLQKLLKLN